MESLQQNVNKVWDIAVFLQMIAAFDNELDFNEFSKILINFEQLIKESNKQEIKKKLPEIETILVKMFETIKLKYPLKRDYQEIAKDWNNKFKIDKETFSKGIMIGWLEEQIDLTNFYRYDYSPYQFKVGLVIHKGRGEIEDNFLLQDSFSSLIKAEKGLELLEKYAGKQKDFLKSKGQIEFNKETLDILNYIKYDVSFYSRLTILSFYSFLECFVNSIGYDHYLRYSSSLNPKEIEILQGKEKGRFLNLKQKIEKFQKIIRSDKAIKIVLTDEKQIKESFKTLFDYYEELRNSSVHYSPLKSRIWMKPHDWVHKSLEFSKLIVDFSIEIWKSCHETNKGPDYLGRLEYERLYEMAKLRENKINELKKNLIINYDENRLL